MSMKIDQFDEYLADDGPAAIVLREHLMPVEGEDGVFFPATFAAAENPRDFAGGYNIDTFGKDGEENVCLVDSVGSQANRIEPIFDARNFDGKYGKLVPQVVVEAGEKSISIFEAGHRGGDAIVRCSALQDDLHNAFKSVLMGDCEPLARIAPTSLVFGVWDSRDTQAKLPRLVTSTIRAFNVKTLTRSAQFNPATNFVGNGLLEEPDKKTKGSYSERGFIHVPATASPGGVFTRDDIRRDATLSIAALRLIHASDPEKQQPLQRYILGLALTAFTYVTSGYLRAGCNLVLNPNKESTRTVVHGNGTNEPLKITHDEALEYASLAADEFGVGEDRDVKFDKKLAKADLKA